MLINHNKPLDANVNVTYLVGGLEHFLFFHVLGILIIPTDELHHFSEGFKPPTRLLLTIINHIITIDINHILTVYYQQVNVVTIY